VGTGASEIIERRARIFNTQKYSIYDGPGIRTLIFFKGCPLRCKWCSNPEGQERKLQVLFKRNMCIDCGFCAEICPVKIHKMVQTSSGTVHQVDRSIDCIGCHQCEQGCPRQALSITGEDKSISEILNIIEEDMEFYRTSGGGVTLGGGEVLAQPVFATNLLMECKILGIDTAIETCGYTSLENILKVAEFTDLFLYDIKQIDSDKHYELTGVHNEQILENLQELIKRKFNVKVRMPIIKGMNDDEKTIKDTIKFLEPFKDYKNFQGIDILPYHKMGISKYEQLGMTYEITEDLSLSKDDLERIQSYVRDCNYLVKVIEH